MRPLWIVKLISFSYFKLIIGSSVMGKQGSHKSLRPEFQGWHSKTLLLHGLKSDSSKCSYCRGLYVGKKHIRAIVVMFGLLGCLFLLDSLVISYFEFTNLQPSAASNSSSVFQVQVHHLLPDSTLLEFLSANHFRDYIKLLWKYLQNKKYEGKMK